MGQVHSDKIIKYCDMVMEWCLYLLIFCLPFAKAGVSIFTVLAALAWIVKRIAGFRSDGLKGMIPFTSLNRALAFFVLMNIVSVIFSVDPRFSLLHFFAKTIKFIAIFFMMVETINTEKRVKRLLWAIFLSALLIGVDAGVQYFRGVDFLKGYEFNERLGASFISGNDFAAWLVIILSALFGWALDIRRKSKWLSMALTVVALFLFVCLVLAYCRGGWLGFVIAASAMIGYVIIKASFSRRVLYLCVAGSLVLTFLLLPQSVKTKINGVCKSKYGENDTLTGRMASVLSMKEGSVPIRFNLWRESLAIIKDHPLTGCGLNTYSNVAPKYKIADDGGIYPHNSYLQMAAEIGLLGLGAFFWIVWSFFAMVVRYLNQHKDYLVLGLAVGLLGFLVHAFFDTHLYALQLVVLFWFMMGLTTAVVKVRTP